MVALIRRNGEPAASCFVASAIETICRVLSVVCFGTEEEDMVMSASVVAAFLRFLDGSLSFVLCLRFRSGRLVSVDMLELLDRVVELSGSSFKRL